MKIRSLLMACLAVFGILLLSGCTKEIVKKEFIFTTPDDSWLSRPAIPHPPLSSDSYSTMSSSDKEAILMDYTFDLLSVLMEQDKDKIYLKEWKDRIVEEEKKIRESR